MIFVRELINTGNDDIAFVPIDFIKPNIYLIVYDNDITNI